MRASVFKIVAVLMLIAFCFTFALAEEHSQANSHLAPEPLNIWFMNTGKSDCILVYSGERAALIDTGWASSVPTIVGVLKEAGVTHLDSVFLTHTHKDHIGGLEGLLSLLTVEKVYRAKISETNKNGENKIDLATESACMTPVRLTIGNVIPFAGDCAFTVLAPYTYNSEDDNDNSLVLMLEAYGIRILLTGDMKYAEEETLLISGSDISADILKVGHHGGPDATSEAFLNAVKPRYAVITTDRAVRAKSANPMVMDAIKSIGADCFVTDTTDSGIRFLIMPDGEITFDFPELPKAADIPLTVSLDRVEQCVSVKNNGTEIISLSGFMIYSEKGDIVYMYPDDTIVEPGSILTLTGMKGEGKLKWPEVKKPFPKEEKGAVHFYDMYGNLLWSFD